MEEKPRSQGNALIQKAWYIAPSYQRLDWGPDSLSPFISLSFPYQLQLCSIHTLNHLQCKASLICRQPLLCVWMRSPRSTRQHPRGTAVVMATMPITVGEWEGEVSGDRAGGCHWRRWLFQSSDCLPPSFFGNSPHPTASHPSPVWDLFEQRTCWSVVALKYFSFSICYLDQPSSQ